MRSRNRPKRQRLRAKLAAQKGKTLPAAEAALLVQISGCDYYTMASEVAKLTVFADGDRITSEHVRACASKSLEYNIFALHENACEKRQAQAAKSLLEDVMQRERPEALVGLFARKVRDMYKTKAMSEAGFNAAKIAVAAEDSAVCSPAADGGVRPVFQSASHRFAQAPRRA